MARLIKFFPPIVNFYRRAVRATNQDEDTARREFILKVLLLFSLHLVGLTIIVTSCNWYWAQVSSYRFEGVSPLLLTGIAIFLVLVYFLVTKHKITLGSYLFLLTLWLPAAYTSWRWGALLNQAILIYAIIIVFTGILLNSLTAFGVAILTSIYLVTLAQLQQLEILLIDQTWRQTLPGLGSNLTIAFSLVFLAIIAWLANREIIKALQRARNSEKALNQQLELFHDIRNPLTSVWLNLETVQAINGQNKQIPKQVVNQLEATLSSLEQVDELLDRSKETLPTRIKIFEPTKIVKQSLKLLQPQAAKTGVKLHFFPPKKIVTLRGDPFKFRQVMNNLVANAIEAYQGLKPQAVEVRLMKKSGYLVLTVTDFGCGIKNQDKHHLFTPLYSTKAPENNFGLGLKIVRGAVEDHFGGQLEFRSRGGKTVFKATFPSH